MTKALSLHLGLNRIDAAVYGSDGALAGCENDAASMQEIASSLGYKTKKMLTAQAVSGQVIKEITNAANELSSGDIFLLTYAGHGSQVPDIAGDEEDGQDETWVLYDRMLLDDELHKLWSYFKPGVRIAVISDSCHSGTVTRAFYIALEKSNLLTESFRNFIDPLIGNLILRLPNGVGRETSRFMNQSNGPHFVVPDSQLERPSCC